MVNLFLKKSEQTWKIEEYIYIYRLCPSCPTQTGAAVEQVQWAVVRCCKCFLWMIFWGVCNRFFVAPVFSSAHILFWPTLWTSTSLSPKFFTKWMMWMASVTWFNTICSKPFPTGFPSETIGLQISKTLFPCNSVISLNYESLQYWTSSLVYKPTNISLEGYNLTATSIVWLKVKTRIRSLDVSMESQP